MPKLKSRKSAPSQEKVVSSKPELMALDIHTLATQYPDKFNPVTIAKEIEEGVDWLISLLDESCDALADSSDYKLRMRIKAAVARWRGQSAL